jgi:hypothetical protein
LEGMGAASGTLVARRYTRWRFGVMRRSWGPTGETVCKCGLHGGLASGCPMHRMGLHGAPRTEHARRTVDGLPGATSAYASLGGIIPQGWKWGAAPEHGADRLRQSATGGGERAEQPAEPLHLRHLTQHAVGNLLAPRSR